MYNLGKNVRLRYYKLLPPNGLYTKENMYVLSSYAERCQMSAASFLAGLMPPLVNRNSLPIPWQPIPINSVQRDRDYVMLCTHKLLYINFFHLIYLVNCAKETLSKV